MDQLRQGMSTTSSLHDCLTDDSTTGTCIPHPWARAPVQAICAPQSPLYSSGTARTLAECRPAMAAAPGGYGPAARRADRVSRNTGIIQGAVPPASWDKRQHFAGRYNIPGFYTLLTTLPSDLSQPRLSY